MIGSTSANLGLGSTVHARGACTSQTSACGTPPSSGPPLLETPASIPAAEPALPSGSLSSSSPHAATARHASASRAQQKDERRIEPVLAGFVRRPPAVRRLSAARHLAAPHATSCRIVGFKKGVFARDPANE